MKRQFNKYLRVFLLILLICFVFKLISFSLPDSRIKENIEGSEFTIEMNGDYPILPVLNKSGDWEYTARTCIDYYTEWITVNCAYNVDVSHPIKSSVLNIVYLPTPDYPAASLLECIRSTDLDEEKFVPKTQYWWGSVAITRCLFLFWDYSQIIVGFRGVLYFVLVLALIEISKKKSIIYSLLFALALIVVNFDIVTYMFHFGMVWMIALCAIIYLCRRETKPEDDTWLLIIGMLTAYFDWLSNPSITCTIPLLVFYFVFPEGCSSKKWICRIGDLVVKGLVWCMGYAGMIVSKSVITSIVLHQYSFGTALERFSNDVGIDGNPVLEWIDTLVLSKRMLVTTQLRMNWIWIFLVIGCVLCIVKYGESYDYLLIFIISIIPFVWGVAFTWHTHEHFWFTFRNFTTLIVAVLWVFIGYINHMCSVIHDMCKKSQQA